MPVYKSALEVTIINLKEGGGGLIPGYEKRLA